MALTVQLFLIYSNVQIIFAHVTISTPSLKFLASIQQNNLVNKMV